MHGQTGGADAHRRWSHVYFAGVLLTLCANPAQALLAHARSFLIPEHGLLVLNVPDSWTAELHQPPRNLPPTIIMAPKSGRAFRLPITVLWNVRPGRDITRPEWIRSLVGRAGEQARARAVEKTLAIKEFGRPGEMGYFISLTDKAPERGGYRYLTQGAIKVGQLVLVFTFLANKAAAAEQSVVLGMLSSAKQVIP